MLFFLFLNVVFTRCNDHLSFLHLTEIRVICYDGCTNVLPSCFVMVCVVSSLELGELNITHMS